MWYYTDDAGLDNNGFDSIKTWPS